MTLSKKRARAHVPSLWRERTGECRWASHSTQHKPPTFRGGKSSWLWCVTELMKRSVKLPTAIPPLSPADRIRYLPVAGTTTSPSFWHLDYCLAARGRGENYRGSFLRSLCGCAGRGTGYRKPPKTRRSNKVHPRRERKSFAVSVFLFRKSKNHAESKRSGSAEISSLSPIRVFSLRGRPSTTLEPWREGCQHRDRSTEDETMPS